MGARLETIRLEYVHHAPDKLGEGVLYVALAFGTALHLCACGCSQEVATPIQGAKDGWIFKEESDRTPTLFPSIGSLQLPCKSHYFISAGRILWC